MGKKKNRLPYIPTSKNFSEFPYNKEEDFNIEDTIAVEDDLTNATKDAMLLGMLGTLRTDRERVILLLQIMRGDGYEFDHNRIAGILDIHIRWYFRILEKIKKDLKPFQTGDFSH